MVNNFYCAFIDHGVTFFPDGKIGPCCQINTKYLVPLDKLQNDNRFDCIIDNYNDACEVCISHENNGMPGYRAKKKINLDTNIVKFIDIRNSSECNLKCRICGPHFSNKWAKELGVDYNITNIDTHLEMIISKETEWIYITGGEPLINKKHWELLQQLVDKGYSKNISLQYNTNLTTVKYKNIRIGELWANFKEVTVFGSVDGIDEEFNYLRSGGDWDKVKHNIITLKEYNINFSIQLVLSILNVWTLPKTLKFFKDIELIVNIHILTGPDILTLNAMPDSLKDKALEILHSINYHNQPVINHAIKLVKENLDKDLFNETLLYVLALDKIRGENLYDLLPFNNELLRVIKNDI